MTCLAPALPVRSTRHSTVSPCLILRYAGSKFSARMRTEYTLESPRREPDPRLRLEPSTSLTEVYDSLQLSVFWPSYFAMTFIFFLLDLPRAFNEPMRPFGVFGAGFAADLLLLVNDLNSNILENSF